MSDKKKLCKVCGTKIEPKELIKAWEKTWTKLVNIHTKCYGKFDKQRRKEMEELKEK